MRVFKNYVPVLVGLFSLLMVSCKKDEPDPVPTPTPAPAPELKLVKISGDNQTGLGNQLLAEPLKVRFTNESGAAVPNKFIEFLVISGDGALSSGRVLTDQNGESQVTWTLGPTAPVQKAKAFLLDANNQPVASTVVEFTARLKEVELHKVSGDNQTGWNNSMLDETLKVRFLNRAGLPEANKPIEFTVTAGNGTLSTSRAFTNHSGEAEVLWTLGPTAPVQKVKAYVVDANNQPIPTTELEFTANMRMAPVVQTVAGGTSAGSSSNELDWPMGVFLDATGNLYIADVGNHRIQKWAPGASSGTTMAGGPNWGSGPNQLRNPTGVFVAVNGSIYIADNYNMRIQLWGQGASNGTTVAGSYTSWGSLPNQLKYPAGVFVDAAWNIYIADSENHRIQKWAPGATSGVTVAGGSFFGGSGAHELRNPTGVFVDASGNIYIADRGNNRIQKWAPGATSGVTVAGGNGSGIGANQLNAPFGVFVDANGNVFVADTDNHRIQKWAPGATSGVTVAGIDVGGPANQLSKPSGVCVDASGNIFIADTGRNRVLKWVP